MTEKRIRTKHLRVRPQFHQTVTDYASKTERFVGGMTEVMIAYYVEHNPLPSPAPTHQTTDREA